MTTPRAFVAEAGRGVHDMGGLLLGGEAGKLTQRVANEHEYEPWEKRVDALMMLLSHSDRQLLKVDELRRNIESLGADAYEAMTYYERWMFAISQTLLQRGVISIAELGKKMAEVKARAMPLGSHGERC